MASFGRRKIKIDVERVTAENVVSVLNRVLPVHYQNSYECQHLYDVYRGRQAVLNRHKNVREEINNKLLVNHANEIVSFKVSYCFRTLTLQPLREAPTEQCFEIVSWVVHPQNARFSLYGLL